MIDCFQLYLPIHFIRQIITGPSITSSNCLEILVVLFQVYWLFLDFMVMFSTEHFSITKLWELCTMSMSPKTTSRILSSYDNSTIETHLIIWSQTQSWASNAVRKERMRDSRTRLTVKELNNWSKTWILLYCWRLFIKWRRVFKLWSMIEKMWLLKQNRYIQRKL